MVSLQVCELTLYGIPALSYSSNTLTKSRDAGTDLVKQIMQCEKYHVVFVDPEHLKMKEWRRIANLQIFQKNLLFTCAEEAHLIDQWGAGFRKDFGFIGHYFCSRFTSKISIFALTVTLEPGKRTLSVCESLGFTEGSFHLI